MFQEGVLPAHHFLNLKEVASTTVSWEEVMLMVQCQQSPWWMSELMLSLDHLSLPPFHHSWLRWCPRSYHLSGHFANFTNLRETEEHSLYFQPTLYILVPPAIMPELFSQPLLLDRGHCLELGLRLLTCRDLAMNTILILDNGRVAEARWQQPEKEGLHWILEATSCHSEASTPSDSRSTVLKYLTPGDHWLDGRMFLRSGKFQFFS